MTDRRRGPSTDGATSDPSDAITPLRLRPSLLDLVMYGAAMWEFQRIHYDSRWAREREGLPGPIVHGPLLGNYLVRMLEGWAGETGSIEKLSWRNHGLALVGESLICTGRVLSRETDGSRDVVKCEIWIRKEDREKVVTGSATVRFPSVGSNEIMGKATS